VASDCLKGYAREAKGDILNRFANKGAAAAGPPLFGSPDFAAIGAVRSRAGCSAVIAAKRDGTPRCKMETLTCRYCQTDIAADSVNCPKCGQNPAGKLTPARFNSSRAFRVGALVGGAVGCVSRVAVVSAFWLSTDHGPPDEPAWRVPVVVFGSCLIGAIIGGIAGGVGSQIRAPAGAGGVIGGLLGGVGAAASSSFTLLPLLCFFTWGGGVGPDSRLRSHESPDITLYIALITIAGVMAGAVGGWVGGRSARK
jgi:hypothetical protein